jgi:uncharacterized membrane protein
MFERTDSVFNIKSVSSNISYKILQNVEFTYSRMQNSYCDHRNFDSVNHSREGLHGGGGGGGEGGGGG